MTSTAAEYKLRKCSPCLNCGKFTTMKYTNIIDKPELCKTCNTQEKLKAMYKEHGELNISQVQRRFYITREHAIKLINYYNKHSN